MDVDIETLRDISHHQDLFAFHSQVQRSIVCSKRSLSGFKVHTHVIYVKSKSSQDPKDHDLNRGYHFKAKLPTVIIDNFDVRLRLYQTPGNPHVPSGTRVQERSRFDTVVIDNFYVRLGLYQTPGNPHVPSGTRVQERCDT
eukprot:758707-Amorphochlora_amoeboformis.AAC.1